MELALLDVGGIDGNNILGIDEALHDVDVVAQQVVHETGPWNTAITNKVVLGIPSCSSIPGGGFSSSFSSISNTPPASYVL
jgi:hypothetical protein